MHRHQEASLLKILGTRFQSQTWCSAKFQWFIIIFWRFARLKSLRLPTLQVAWLRSHVQTPGWVKIGPNKNGWLVAKKENTCKKHIWYIDVYWVFTFIPHVLRVSWIWVLKLKALSALRRWWWAFSRTKSQKHQVKLVLFRCDSHSERSERRTGLLWSLASSWCSNSPS